MNLIGHNYIAYKLIGHVSPLTILGSHIPDFVPFLPSSVFTFEEIHEDHEELLNFIKQKYPTKTDLPLSMMCHSVKYGADELNREIDNMLLIDNQELESYLIHKIMEMSEITINSAKARLHNYLWCGVDFYLIKNSPQNITKTMAEEFTKIDFRDSAVILSDHYKKDVKIVEQNLRDHFTIITKASFTSEEGFAQSWTKFLNRLPEKDSVTPDKARDLINEIFLKFESEWERVLEVTYKHVKQKMEIYAL